MATSTASPVRKLTSEEVAIVCNALQLQAKSYKRFFNTASNSVIANEYSRQESACYNLINHFKNGSLDV